MTGVKKILRNYTLDPKRSILAQTKQACDESSQPQAVQRWGQQ